MTRTDLEHKIAVLLGGRAAEKLVFGELSTGAADDLARATDIARDMITRFGMDEGLGYIAFEAQRPRFLDTPELAHGGCRVAESTQARIDQAIRELLCQLAIAFGLFWLTEDGCHLRQIMVIAVHIAGLIHRLLQ